MRLAHQRLSRRSAALQAIRTCSCSTAWPRACKRARTRRSRTPSIICCTTGRGPKGSARRSALARPGAAQRKAPTAVRAAQCRHRPRCAALPEPLAGAVTYRAQLRQLPRERSGRSRRSRRGTGRLLIEQRESSARSGRLRTLRTRPRRAVIGVVRAWRGVGSADQTALTDRRPPARYRALHPPAADRAVPRVAQFFSTELYPNGWVYFVRRVRVLRPALHCPALPCRLSVDTSFSRPPCSAAVPGVCRCSQPDCAPAPTRPKRVSPMAGAGGWGLGAGLGMPVVSPSLADRCGRVVLSLMRCAATCAERSTGYCGNPTCTAAAHRRRSRSVRRLRRRCRSAWGSPPQPSITTGPSTNPRRAAPRRDTRFGRRKRAHGSPQRSRCEGLGPFISSCRYGRNRNAHRVARLREALLWAGDVREEMLARHGRTAATAELKLLKCVHTAATFCAGTGLTAATSAPGLGSPLPHLHQDWGSRAGTSTPQGGIFISSYRRSRCATTTRRHPL